MFCHHGPQWCNDPFPYLWAHRSASRPFQMYLQFSSSLRRRSYSLYIKATLTLTINADMCFTSFKAYLIINRLWFDLKVLNHKYSCVKCSECTYETSWFSSPLCSTSCSIAVWYPLVCTEEPIQMQRNLHENILNASQCCIHITLLGIYTVDTLAYLTKEDKSKNSVQWCDIVCKRT